jgi:CBS-domain-containing membrane protein
MVTDRDIVCKGRDDDDLAKAVRHMEELKVRRLPVINKNRRMIGILSRGDVSGLASSDLLTNALRACRPTTTEREEPSPGGALLGGALTLRPKHFFAVEHPR